MNVKVLVNSRGSAQPNFAEGTDISLQSSNKGALIVTDDLPQRTWLVNAGNSYQASTTTAAAPVTAIPTTAALIGLWNGEPDGGKSYVIDSVFAIWVANTAAVQNLGILGNMSLGYIPTAIANTITPRPLRGGIGYRGAARVAVGITLNATDGVASNWFPIGPSVANTNTPQIGCALDVDCQGRYIVPPGNQFSLTAIAGAATASSVQIGLRWHEVMLPNVI